MTFEEKILKYENTNGELDYILVKGKIPVFITAPHTMKQIRKDGSIKYGEIFTKAIAMYLNEECKCSYLVKIHDTGSDSNRDNHDEFKRILIDFVKKYNIKLVIDLHGADRNRDFDVELGTMNNLTADITTIRELENSFNQHGIVNIEHNNPFKGGAITQYLYNIKDVEVIQLEINGRYRDYKNVSELKKICDSLLYFIKKFVNYGE